MATKTIRDEMFIASLFVYFFNLSHFASSGKYSSTCLSGQTWGTSSGGYLCIHPAYHDPWASHKGMRGSSRARYLSSLYPNSSHFSFSPPIVTKHHQTLSASHQLTLSLASSTMAPPYVTYNSGLDSKHLHLGNLVHDFKNPANLDPYEEKSYTEYLYPPLTLLFSQVNKPPLTLRAASPPHHPSGQPPPRSRIMP